MIFKIEYEEWLVAGTLLLLLAFPPTI